MIKKLIIFIFLTLNLSFAQLSLNNTRLIFNNNEKSSQSIMVTNDQSEIPYLIQTWIEDGNGDKVVMPLAALPILQRLNVDQSKYIKVSLIGAADDLATDRETLFFLNILGVPPVASDSEDQISMVLQLTIKLFYRPKNLPKYDEMGWIKELVVKKDRDILRLNNPTPYHIIIYGFASNAKEEKIEKDLVLKPFSSETVDVKLSGNTPYLYIVNDLGAGEVIGFNCGGDNCNIILEQSDENSK